MLTRGEYPKIGSAPIDDQFGRHLHSYSGSWARLPHLPGTTLGAFPDPPEGSGDEKHLMLQAFIITLREGVEAALIVGIVFAYLTKTGRSELKRTVFFALGSAVAASILGAVILAHTQWNSDIFEGWVMLAAACFVVSMIWFMHRAARTMKGDIETRIAGYASGEKGVSRLGLFFFVFLLVLREGVETVLILSAVTLNSTELLSFTGTILGIGVAVVFGVLFIRGSVKINLQRFFRVTTVILYFVAFQLVVSGLHELSENGVLPSSTVEMRLIGPIVRNDLFFFVTMLALAGLMMLLEYRRRIPEAAPAAVASPSPAAIRKAAWSARREKMWMNAVVVTSFLFIFLSTAEFIYAKSATALSPTTPVTLIGSEVTLPIADINDDKLHRFGVYIDDGKGRTIEVRFLLYRKPDGHIVSVADACQICGPVGFYLSSQGIICKMCASPIAPGSMGQPGGCNPIPLNSTIADGQLTITAADLRALAPTFEK
jgi:high-affinity iron transporter